MTQAINAAEEYRRICGADRVLVEDQSRNTYQNMEFSKALILPLNPL